MPLKFGYFNIQGRGQVSRLLLAYTKSFFQDIQYSFSQIKKWIEKDKEGLGLDFPSMPYLIDNSFTLTESKAIESYIIYRAKRQDLLGRNTKEKARIDNIEGVLRDIFNALINLFLDPNFLILRKSTYEKINSQLNFIDLSIGNSEYLLLRVTYPDFLLTVLYTYLKLLFPFQHNQWKNISRVANNINNLDEIKNYYQGSKSVSNLMFPERSEQFNSYELGPINEAALKTTSIQVFGEKSQIIHTSLQTQPKIEQSSATDLKQTINQEIIKPELSSSLQGKQFNTRLKEYMKAAQKTNIKAQGVRSSQSQRAQGIAPSKISSSWIKNQSIQESNVADQLKQNKIVLGYWGIRGLGQIQRHLLAFCRVQFDQRLYRTQPQWLNGDKITLVLPFPNLPYLIDGQLKLTESLAIDRYIIRKSGNIQLLGINLVDQTYIENFVKILSQFFKQLRVLCFTEDPGKKKSQDLLSKYYHHFEQMNTLIKDKQYAFGYLSWVDFYVAQISYYMEKIYLEAYTKLKFFSKIRQSVQNDERIKKYYERQNNVKGPYMPPSAKIWF